MSLSVSEERIVIWLLGEPEDGDLLWLAAALQRRGVNAEFVLPEDLLVGSALTYRIDDRGVVSSMRLHDGRVIDAEAPGLVINRLANLPLIGGGSPAADSSYLAEEWRAALAAWLRTLRCPLLNPPRAGYLVGPIMLPAVWRSIASAHGLASRPWTSTDTDVEMPTRSIDLVSLGTRCIDPSNSVPPVIGRSLAAMARFVGAPLLGAKFERNDEQWVFIEATAYPRLAEAGEQLVDAVIECARTGRLPT